MASDRDSANAERGFLFHQPSAVILFSTEPTPGRFGGMDDDQFGLTLFRRIRQEWLGLLLAVAHILFSY